MIELQRVGAGSPRIYNGTFPSRQILTIEGLLNGTESPRYPDLSRGAVSFKQAKREKKKSKQGKLL